MWPSKNTTRGTVFTVFLLVAQAVTSPVHSHLENHDPPQFPIRHDLDPPTSPSFSPHQSPPQIPPSPQHLHLHHRAPPNAGPIRNAAVSGWQVRYRQYLTFIIPVQVAASVLEEFYNDVLQRVSVNLLSNQPSPGTELTLSMGSVILSFRVQDPAQVLSWRACETIIDVLWTNAKMGFTVQFDSEWFDPETNMLVYVSLAMLQRIRPGLVD